MSMGITRCAAAVCAVMLLTGDANARVEPTGFRIMSFNTHHGETMDKVIDLRKAGEVVNAERPRFAGLQEVDRRTSRIGRQDACDVLAKMTGMHATFAKAISLGGGEYGNALLSREEPLAVRRIPLPGKEPRVLLLCEFADCWVGVTHLAIDSEEARLGSISAIRAAVSDCGAKPVFLMGDWNASPTSKVLAGLREFLTVLSDESGATFHGGRSEPGALDDPDGCIDYIAVDSAHCGDYAVRARRTVRDLRTSDHLPIVVEVAPRRGRDATLLSKDIHMRDPFVVTDVADTVPAAEPTRLNVVTKPQKVAGTRETDISTALLHAHTIPYICTLFSGNCNKYAIYPHRKSHLPPCFRKQEML